jgi:hypothetical protein
MGAGCRARTCWWTSGFVGARKSALPVGNHRWKLYMTTDAISVFPRPVGSETSVLCRTATDEISNWYWRSWTLLG